MMKSVELSRLDQLLASVEQTKNAVSDLERRKFALDAQKDALLVRLQTEFGVMDVEQAKALLVTLQTQMQECVAKIDAYEKTLSEIKALAV